MYLSWDGIVHTILLVNQGIVFGFGIFLRLIRLMHESIQFTMQLGVSTLGVVAENKYCLTVALLPNPRASPIFRLIFQLQTKHFDLVATQHAGHDLVVSLWNRVTMLRRTFLEQTIVASGWILLTSAVALLPFQGHFPLLKLKLLRASGSWA